MKTKLFVILLTVFLFLAVQGNLYAQDPGEQDSIILIPSCLDTQGNDSTFTLELWIWNDEVGVVPVCGFTWDSELLTLDSAKASPEAVAAFNSVDLYEEMNLELANLRNRAGFYYPLWLETINPSLSRKLLATYYFSLSSWSETDVFVIDTGYAEMSFYSYINNEWNNTYEWFPVYHWDGWKPDVRDASQGGCSAPDSLFVSDTSLVFTATQFENLPVTQNLIINSNNPSQTLNWSLSYDSPWLWVSPTGGVYLPRSITVGMNTSNLPPDIYTDTITITSPGAANSPKKVVVQYEVEPHVADSLEVTKNNLEFTALQMGLLPVSQSFILSNNNLSQTLNWSLSNNSTWLNVTPTSGNSLPRHITVGTSTTGLQFDVYRDTILIVSSDSSILSQKVAVQYEIYKPTKIIAPKDSTEVLPNQTIEIYVATYNPVGIDSVNLYITYGVIPTIIGLQDAVSPFTYSWTVPSDLPPGTAIRILATSYASDDNAESDGVFIYVTPLPLPDISIALDKDTTSLGGIVIGDWTITNNSTQRGLFNYRVNGVDSLWLTDGFGTVSLAPGETAENKFQIDLPSVVTDTGQYTIELEVSYDNSDTISTTTTASLYVAPAVQIINRRPANGTRLTDTSVDLTFNTTGPAPCTVKVGHLVTYDSTNWQTFYTAVGYEHKITLDNLIRGQKYVWEIESYSPWGSYTSTELDTFSIVNGVVFNLDLQNLVVGRGYDQHATITATNLDTLPYYVQAHPQNFPPELIIGFVGAGSPDQPLFVGGLEQFTFDLAIHTQDVAPGTYQLELLVESWTADSLAGTIDTAISILPTIIIVTAPELNIEVEIVTIDIETMAHTIVIRNLGDTITDLSVLPSDSLLDLVYLVPQVHHMLLGTSDSVVFEVVPYLTINDPAAPGVLRNAKNIISQFSSALLNDPSGDLLIHYDGELDRLPLDFTVPTDKTVFLGTAKDVQYCIDVNSWYCTNRPSISVKFVTPSGIDPADVPEGALLIDMFPKSHNIPPHDIAFGFNGTELATLYDEVPIDDSVYTFEIPGEAINFASTGNAVNTATIDTEWKTGGHYVVSNKFVMCLCLERYTQYVLAWNQTEADAIVARLPQLSTNDNICNGCICGLHNGGFTGNTNCDIEGKVDLSDIVQLIDRVYLSKVPLCCEENGNVDGDAEALIDLVDIIRLIDHIYITKVPTAICE